MNDALNINWAREKHSFMQLNNLNNLKPKTHNAGKQLSMIMMVNQISHLLYTIEVRISDSDMGLVSA